MKNVMRKQIKMLFGEPLEGNWRLKGLWYSGYEGEGLYRSWFKDDILESEKNYKNGKEHGVERGWYYNGQKHYIRYYKNGKEHGVWKRWNRSGELDLHKVFRNGKFIKKYNDEYEFSEVY